MEPRQCYPGRCDRRASSPSASWHRQRLFDPSQPSSAPRAVHPARCESSLMGGWRDLRPRNGNAGRQFCNERRWVRRPISLRNWHISCLSKAGCIRHHSLESPDRAIVRTTRSLRCTSSAEASGPGSLIGGGDKPPVVLAGRVSSPVYQRVGLSHPTSPVSAGSNSSAGGDGEVQYKRKLTINNPKY